MKPASIKLIFLKSLQNQKKTIIKNMPSIYIGMMLDTLHHGHINIISEARKYGDVIIGLLTDAIADHKRLPYLNYEQRKKIIENISGVSRVVVQDQWDYAPNLRNYKPDLYE